MSSLIMPLVENQFRFITAPGNVHSTSMCGGYDASSKLGAPLKIFAPTYSRFCRNGTGRFRGEEKIEGFPSPTSPPQPKLPSTRYKTELCRTYDETGSCKYGDKCQFAHGMTEVRQMPRHPKYKTEMCRTYHSTGICPYGPRCHFVHESHEAVGHPAHDPVVSHKTGLLVTTGASQPHHLMMEQRRSGSVASYLSGSPPPSSGTESPPQSFSPREAHYDDDIFTYQLSSPAGHYPYQQQQLVTGDLLRSRRMSSSPPVTPPLNGLMMMMGEDFLPASPVDLMMSQFDWLSRTTRGTQGGTQHRLPVFTRLSSSS